jgi:subtilisin-like proprotein convertase family protein
MNRVLLLLLAFLFSAITKAQVSVTATAGTPGPTAYTNLSSAFTAINAGTHQGIITIDISASFTEAGIAVLNSSGAGSASYTSMLIRPTADAVNISFATATGRGIIELNGADNVTIDGDNPNTAGTNRNLTITNTATNAITFTSCVRLATSTLITSCDNITVKNCNLIGSGTGKNAAGNTTEVTTWGVIAAAGASTSAVTNAPSALTSATNTSASGQTMSNLSVDNNNIQTVARGISINGSSGTVFPGLYVSNNIVGNATQGAADQVTAVGITVQGTTNAFVRGNTVRVEGYIESSTPNRAINVGMVSTTGLANVFIERNRVERMINNSPNTYTAFGIDITGGSNHVIMNNFVGNCLNNQTTGTGSFSTTFGAFGIRIGGGTGHKVYHNSVHFTGAVPGSTSTDLVTCFGIVSASSTGMDVRNNIFSNKATGGNTTLYNTVFSSIYLPSGATSAMALTINNNAYYQSGLAYSGIAQVGTTASAANLYLASNFNSTATTGASNLRTYTSSLGVVNSDNASYGLATAPPFVSATDLHIPGGTSTPLESAGSAAGVTLDIDGDTRNATTPDMGADEFAGIFLDNIPPAVSYTALGNIVCIANRTLTANISDAAGINVAAGTKPRVWFKKLTNANVLPGTNTNTTDGWKYAEATNTVSPFTFTIDHSLVFGGVATGDVIQYFVAAQDLATIPNVTINSGTPTGSPASVALTAGNFPITGTINSYNINGLSGTVTVGAAGTYTSLTGAGGLFAAINAGGLSGNLTVNILDASVTETGANALNAIAYGCAGPYNLLIKPNTGVTSTLTGSFAGNALIRIFASNVTIDGSNNGGTSRDLTITNTSTSTPSVLLIASSGTTTTTNDVVKNTNIINGINTSSAMVITDGGTPGNPGYFTNITVQNNNIQKAYIGMYINCAVVAGNGAGMNIASNLLNTTGANQIRFIGVYVQGANGVTITGNDIGNFESTSGETKKGIWLATGTSNTVVEKNLIHDINYTGTSGYGAHGVAVSTGLAAANVTVSNNMIRNLSGDADSYTSFGGTYSPVGVYAFGTGQGGVNIYYNTIFLSGNTLNFSAAAHSFGILLDNNVTANVRNNIIHNNLGRLGTTGAGAVGIGAVTSAAQFVGLDYNDYWVASTGSGGNWVGKIGATNYTTLAAFQAATSADANSKNIQPVYVSATDLHLSTANGVNWCLNAAATPIASITVDIDNDTRSATTPDMGADEFTATGFVVNNPPAVCSPATVDLTAAAVTSGSMAGLTYTYFTDAAATAVLANPNAVSVAGTYYIKASNGTCSMVLPVVVTINQGVTVSGTLTQPTTCASADGAITLTMGGAPGPYGFVWTGPGVNVNAQNQTGLTIGNYGVTVTAANTCQATGSFSLVGPGGCFVCPTVANVSTNPTPGTCIGSNVTISTTGLVSMGTTYGITFKQSTSALADPYAGGTVIATVPNGSLTSGGTAASTITTFAAANNYFIYAILSPTPVDPACRPSAVVNLTVNPTPTVNAVSNQSLCAGAATTAVNFSGAVAGTVYNWTNNTPSIGLAASGSGNIASFTAQNAGATAVTATITVTPSYTNAGATCTGTPTTFTITVNPTTSVNNIANQVVCAGSSTAAVTFSGGQAGTVYNWTNNTPSIGLAASGSGNIAAFTAVNTGTTPVIATITVTPVLGTCSGTPKSFTITVNPNPVLTIVADPGTTLCAGDPTLLTVITGTGLVTFTAPPANIAIPGTGTGSSAAPAPAAVYPINLSVSGLPTSGVTVKSVTVMGLSHTWMSDVNILLQSPTGQNVVIMADCGRGGDLANHTLTFDDAAPLNLNNTLGGTDPPASGTTWKPTNLTDYLFPASDPDNWPAPGPGVFGSQLPLSTFTGDFNGTWKMFITDDGGGDVGSINGGYNIVFSAPAGVPTGYTFLWTPAAGLSSTTTNPVAASPATTTTYTVTGTTAQGCSRQASITINVNQRPAISSQPVATTVCAGGTATFTAAGTGTGATLLWQVSTDGGGTWTNLTNAAPYSNVTTGTLTINPVTIAMNGYRYRLSVSGTCPPTAYSVGAVLNVNPLPVVTISPAGPVCGGVAGTNGVLLTASSPTGGNFTWSPATGLYTNAAATIAYVAGTPTATVYAAPAVNTTYTVSATNPTTGCVGTGTVLVNYTPNAPTVNPASATICLGTRTPLTITSSLAPVTVSGTSGTVNIAIPDGTGDPALSTINIAGIPGAAVISEIKVTLNITHTWVGDLDINLVAPNGNRLNLVGGLDGGTGSNGTDNFTNTIISSLSNAAISGAPAPRSSTYGAEKRAGYGPTGYEQNVPDWNGLTSTPNGPWRLAVGDFATLDGGTINSWSLDITYGLPAGGIWTPATGLYLDAAGTIPYVAGTQAVTVYAGPLVSTTYSVTVSSGTCTSPARTVPVTVNVPVAITSVSADQTICTDKVATFTVVATGTAPAYQWQVSTNNGNTWANITNGGVYTGATTATLTITAPPVSMNNYQYRVIVNGAAPCGSVTSAIRTLKVNPLPVIVISAAPYTRLFPGLTTTLSSSVSPNAAATYTWRRNGVVVAGATAATLGVNVDGLGLYSLLVTDVNGCTNVSNSVLISDSVNTKLFIYPNPTTGRFQVRYYSVNANTLVRGLTIYNSEGQRVLVQQNSITAPYARMDVDMSKFSKGIYWVELGDMNGNRLAVGRVVIQ